MKSILCRYVVAGVLAAAAGTTALYATTYLDQVVRGRPSSDLPERTAGRLADLAGLGLGEGDKAESRKQGIGALLGIGTGVVLGAAYGGLRIRVREVSVPVGGVGLGLVATVVANTPMTALGLTDPRTWGTAGWLSDLVPHLVFGLVTAYAFHMMADQAGSRRNQPG
ncbi:hypothetical protein GCM10022226_05590 [Sphaerisporangium flaviroseum]|uniref:DUF1440 domain-containing protein n=1 Tax=Sphaerisporangium flaviroseum TaxID=509199 RepID=A0ABP7HCR4_9ACTN